MVLQNKATNTYIHQSLINTGENASVSIPSKEEIIIKSTMTITLSGKPMAEGKKSLKVLVPVSGNDGHHSHHSSVLIS